MKRMVTYPKEMQDYAKQNEKHLITLDIPGLCYQSPATAAEVKKVFALFKRLIGARKKQSETRG